MSRARTVAPLGSGHASGDGRPGVPSGAARPSVTSPPATSSPMRPRIALRVSPVRATSPDLERGPHAWSSRTIALRLARRTVSLRCPISSRPMVTGFVFLLLNRATLVHCHGGVKRLRGCRHRVSTMHVGRLDLSPGRSLPATSLRWVHDLSAAIRARRRRGSTPAPVGVPSRRSWNWTEPLERMRGREPAEPALLRRAGSSVTRFRGGAVTRGSKRTAALAGLVGVALVVAGRRWPIPTAGSRSSSGP